MSSKPAKLAPNPYEMPIIRDADYHLLVAYAPNAIATIVVAIKKARKPNRFDQRTHGIAASKNVTGTKNQYGAMTLNS